MKRAYTLKENTNNIFFVVNATKKRKGVMNLCRGKSRREDQFRSREGLSGR